MSSMRNSKLVYLLQLLSPGEQQKFGRYLKSSYFNKKTELSKLLELTLKIANTKFKDQSEQELYKKLSGKPTPKFDINWFRKIKTELTYQLLNFLSQQEYELERGFKKNLLLQALNRRSCDKYFKFYAQETEKIITQYPYQDSAYYQLALSYEDQLISHSGKLNHNDRHHHILNGLEKNEYNFLLNKLRYALEARVIEASTEHPISIPGLDDNLNFIEKKIHTVPPILKIYYRLYSIFQDEKDSPIHYEAVKKLLPKYWKILSNVEKSRILNYILHYIKVKTTESNELLEEQFFWHQHFIESGFLLKDQAKFPDYFRQITSIACRLEEFEWVNRFFKQHGNQLLNYGIPAEYYFNKAVIKFHEGKFEEAKALFILAMKHNRLPINSIESSAYLLMTHYELGEFATVEEMSFSFSVYLNREKNISKKRKQPYYKIAKYIHKLNKLRERKDIKALEKLHERINKSSIGAFPRNWLRKHILKLARKQSY